MAPSMVAGKPGLSAATFRQGQPRLLNVFASWCVPCIAEAPQLMRLKAAGVPIDAIAVRDTGPAITGFSGRGFRIDGRVHAGAVKLTPERAWDWDAPALDALAEADLTDLVAVRPEFILLGTGPSLARPARALVAALDARGIGIEAMDSRAAARAWGLLRGEGREVCAALLGL